MRLALLATFLVGSVAAAQAPTSPTAAATAKRWPLTRPEVTGFAETSRYDEVVAYMKAMAGHLAEDSPHDVRLHI